YTPDVVRLFCDSRLRYYYQDNRERSAARNLGIQKATGEYICFLDADDFYLPCKLETQVTALEQNPGFDVVYSDVRLCDAEGNCIDAKAAAPHLQPSGDILAHLVRRNWITIHAPLFRRSCFHEQTWFDESLTCFEDWDLWLRIACEARFLYVPGPVACYRIHREMTSNQRKRMWQGALEVRRKIEVMPQFQTLPHAVQQYSRFQHGLLESLVGDLLTGRRLLANAFFGQPMIPGAAGIWLLSLLGQSAFGTLWNCWASRRDWLRTANRRTHGHCS
ncbi:MAG: glycosyltransferase, partial [Chloroflexi bacterium]|nr:glycosyltransferase [Chloroflexota bacterium]